MHFGYTDIMSIILIHNLISDLFVFFICMDYLGCYWHLVKMSVNSTFRNVFTEKNGDGVKYLFYPLNAVYILIFREKGLFF